MATGRAADDVGDLVEGHREQVVQHERHPFGGAQRLEDDLEREADAVGHQGLELGVAAR